MKKMITVDYDEYSKLSTTIETLRRENQKLTVANINLTKELDFLKSNGGDNILVIVKDKNNIYEYKSTEKSILVDLVSENKKLRESLDEMYKLNTNIENQKNVLIFKYQEMENMYKMNLNQLQSIEKRSLMDRILNKKVEVTKVEPLMLQQPVIDITVTSNIDKRPKGWNLMSEFIDEDGNVYKKGKLIGKK